MACFARAMKHINVRLGINRMTSFTARGLADGSVIMDPVRIMPAKTIGMTGMAILALPIYALPCSDYRCNSNRVKFTAAIAMAGIT